MLFYKTPFLWACCLVALVAGLPAHAQTDNVDVSVWTDCNIIAAYVTVEDSYDEPLMLMVSHENGDESYFPFGLSNHGFIGWKTISEDIPEALEWVLKAGETVILEGESEHDCTTTDEDDYLIEVMADCETIHVDVDADAFERETNILFRASYQQQVFSLGRSSHSEISQLDYRFVESVTPIRWRALTPLGIQCGETLPDCDREVPKPWATPEVHITMPPLDEDNPINPTPVPPPPNDEDTSNETDTAPNPAVFATPTAADLYNSSTGDDIVLDGAVVVRSETQNPSATLSFDLMCDSDSPQLEIYYHREDGASDATDIQFQGLEGEAMNLADMSLSGFARSFELNRGFGVSVQSVDGTGYDSLHGIAVAQPSHQITVELPLDEALTIMVGHFIDDQVWIAPFESTCP